MKSFHLCKRLIIALVLFLLCFTSCITMINRNMWSATTIYNDKPIAEHNSKWTMKNGYFQKKINDSTYFLMCEYCPAPGVEYTLTSEYIQFFALYRACITAKENGYNTIKINNDLFDKGSIERNYISTYRQTVTVTNSRINILYTVSNQKDNIVSISVLKDNVFKFDNGNALDVLEYLNLATPHYKRWKEAKSINHFDKGGKLPKIANIHKLRTI